MILGILIDKGVSRFREESLVEPSSVSGLMPTVIEKCFSLVECVGDEPSVLLKSLNKGAV